MQNYECPPQMDYPTNYAVKRNMLVEKYADGNSPFYPV